MAARGDQTCIKLEFRSTLGASLGHSSMSMSPRVVFNVTCGLLAYKSQNDSVSKASRIKTEVGVA